MVSPLISLQVNDVSSNKKEEKIKKRHEEVKTSEQKEINGLIKKGQPIDLESKKLKEKEKEQVIKKSDDSKIVESPRKSRVKLATSLVNLFKSKNEATQEKDNTKTFSLLEQFDKDDNMELRKEENDSSSEVKDDDKAPLSGLFKSSKQRDTRLEKSKEKAVLLQKQLLEDSNDDDLSEQDQGEDSENDTSTIQIPSLENKTEKQLIEAGRIDIRFSKELWLQRWEELRPTIVKLYKRKHKEALKSKRVDNEMKRKKEFLKNAKKGHWNRKR
ncbi:unnamed protein product [Lymnaea stagnalis]|uniref:Uncharacterized protein n=1 Tax=Lymnaea stagnalis TaxID=6523 RepID=A0AAV2I778_LYMST